MLVSTVPQDDPTVDFVDWFERGSTSLRIATFPANRWLHHMIGYWAFLLKAVKYIVEERPHECNNLT